MNRVINPNRVGSMGLNIRAFVAAVGILASSACSIDGASGKTSGSENVPVVTTENPVDKFRSNLEVPTKKLSIDIVSELIELGDVTERSIYPYYDDITVNFNNRAQAVGPDLKFGTTDDQLDIPVVDVKAVNTTNGAAYVVIRATKGSNTEFEASYRATEWLDPTKMELRDVLDLLSRPGAAELIGLNAISSDSESAKFCSLGLEVFPPEGPAGVRPTIGCSKSVDDLSSTITEQGHILHQDTVLRAIGLRSSEEIKALVNELPKAASEIQKGWK